MVLPSSLLGRLAPLVHLLCCIRFSQHPTATKSEPLNLSSSLSPFLLLPAPPLLLLPPSLLLPLPPSPSSSLLPPPPTYLLMAKREASRVRAMRSAPTNPGVRWATSENTNPSSNFRPRQRTERILRREEGREEGGRGGEGSNSLCFHVQIPRMGPSQRTTSLVF